MTMTAIAQEICNDKVQALKTAISKNLLNDDIPLAGFIDIEGIKNTVAQLKASFPSHFHHHFAVKANSMHGVLSILRAHGVGAEVASPGELAQALKAGFAKEDIVFDEPAKSKNVIKTALEHGVNLNIDNFEEFKFVEALVGEINPSCNIGFRINPQIGAGSIVAMSTATKTSKFGIPIEDEGVKQALIDLYVKHPWLNSMHSHVGSQGCPLPLMADGIRALVDLVEQINHEAGYQQIKHINIGGGLSVNFDGEEVEPSYQTYSDLLAQMVPELFSGKYRILTEFGRTIMAKNGFFASKVEYAKESGGRSIAITHAGSQLAARTTFMPKAWPLRITAHDNNGEPKSNANVVQDIAGPCCFAGDLLARERALPKLEKDDYIMVHETGAYYFSNPFYYNSLPAPPVYGFTRGDNQSDLLVMRKGQTIEEMMEVIG